MIPAKTTASSIGFSRYLGLPAAAAMGVAVGVGVAVFVGGFGILEISGDEAPLAYALAMVLFLPLILSYAERALELPGSGAPYQLAAASGSPRQAFAAGWLLLGGAVPLAALLVRAIVSRLDAGLGRLFAIEVAEAWLVVAVAAAAGVHVLLAEPSRWRTRTVVVWGSVLALVGVFVWAFFQSPSAGGAVPERKPLDHWLSSVALLGAALWSLEPILHHRPQLRGGGRALLQAMLVAWITALGIAIAAVLLLLRRPGLLMENWVARLSWSENRLELLTLAVGAILCLAALFRTISGAMRLFRAMVRDGFLPAWLGTARSSEGAPAGGLGLFLLAAALLATRPEVLPLAGAASLAFLWATVVVLAPRLKRRSRDLPAGRPLKLPLHPLFPLLAVAGALFFSLILPSWSLRLGLGWSLVGVLYFLAYARRGSLAVQRRELVIAEPAMCGPALPETPERGAETPYRVLVWAADADVTRSLIRLGGALARARRGELLVLRVVRLVEQLPLTELRDQAEDEWRRLDRLAGGADRSGARIRTLVRIAPTPAAGVLETVAEARADFLLLGAPAGDGETDAQETLERVFAATSRPLAVLHGSLPEGIGRVLVASAGGPHAPAALELGDALAGGATAGGATAEAGRDSEAPLGLLAVAARGRRAEAAAEAARQTLEKAAPRTAVEIEVAEARNVAEGLERAAGAGDVLLLGASVDRLLGQTVLGGLPAEVAAARSGPTVIVKRGELARRFWLRRLWAAVYDLLPTLGVGDRAEVFALMRRQARAGVDYYVQIFLAAAIAVLGLRLDSAAVIIGAMLVAPLMSPILGVAHGIVQGNLYLIRRGADSTAKGVGVAIGVSLAAALLLPPGLPTREMLARGQPNVLDLLVALAAGAAAAYAVSRRSVAAALPGVAISVALVPPLCVAGHALGASDFPLAGGALLLFLTNLAGIILIGATVFLLLGFRPTRAARGRRVGRGILYALAAILLLAVPLGLETRTVTRAGRLEAGLEAEIAAGLRRAGSGLYRVQEYSVERRRGGLLVVATLFAYGDLGGERLEEIRRRLSEVAGVPVTIDLTVVDATRIEAGPISSAPSKEASPR